MKLFCVSILCIFFYLKKYFRKVTKHGVGDRIDLEERE